MTYPRRYLVEGEKVIVERGLHWVRLLVPVSRAVLLFSGCGAGFLLWKNAPRWFGLVLGIIFVATLGYLFLKVMAFRSTQFVLTNRRIIYRSGVFRRASRDIPLGSVQRLETRRPLLRRMIGVGDLKISSTGEGEAEPFYDLRRPGELESLIHKAMEDCEADRIRKAMTPEPTVDPHDQHQRMVELHHRGVITVDELEHFRRSLGLEGAERPDAGST